MVPELDLLTSLYDRRSFEAILDREIFRARDSHRPLFLLLVDVDRLTTLNAQIGRLAADGALLVVAERLRAHVDRLDYMFRLVGGRFAVVRLGGTATTRRSCSPRCSDCSTANRSARPGSSRSSAGIVALLAHDDAASLAERADTALADAKRARRGSVANGN